jgi:hypothetical protein
MSVSPVQKARLLALAEKTKGHLIKGAFTAELEQEVSPKALALELWVHGYIPVPTVEALVEAMEKEVESFIEEKSDN